MAGEKLADQLQIVVLGEVENETVSHRLDFVQSPIDMNRLLSLVGPRTDVGRIAHPLLGAEDRENATQPFGPVARTKLPAASGQTDDDE